MGSFLIGPKILVIDEQSDGSYYGVNMRQFLRMIQALVQANVINLTTANPPATPNNGDTYIVAAAPTGAWTGQANSIAYWTTDNPIFQAGVWEFWTPRPGWIVGNLADESPYIFNGTIWVKIGGSSSFGAGSYMYGAGVMDHPFVLNNLTSISANEINGSFIPAGTLVCYLFQLLVPLSLSKCSAQANATQGGFTSAFALYTESGNLLVNGGSFNSLQSPVVQTNSFGSVLVPPGLYYHIQVCNQTAVNAQFLGFQLNSSGLYSYITNTFNINTPRFATAANLATQGPNNGQGNPTTVLPATLGALTEFTPSGADADGFCAPLWE